MIPIYSEVSNRERQFLRTGRVLSVVLYLQPMAHPVSALNSLYQLLQNREDVELLLIADEKDAYQYDTLMEKFPVLRVIFPERFLTIPEAVEIGCRESFSKNVLFMDDSVLVESLPLEIFSLYFDDPQYGIIVPHLFSPKNEVIPSQVKYTVKNGFFHTLVWDKPQNAVTSLYPLSFCFILNREMYLDKGIQFVGYEHLLYTLAELGWRVWKSGAWVIQVRQWRVVLPVQRESEMFFSSDDDEYLWFHFRNVSHKSLVNKQNRLIFPLLLKRFVGFRWKGLGKIWECLMKRGKTREELGTFPIEDLAIFSIINNEKA